MQEMRESVDAAKSETSIGPVQFDLFTGKPLPALVRMEDDLFIEEGVKWELAAGVSLVQSKDAAQLVLDGFGLFLAKKSERLVVKEAGKAVYEFPFFRLGEVVVASRGVSLSSDLIEELCRRGIRVSFLGGGGRPYAMLTSPMLTATVHTRRAQILAFNDGRGFEFSRRVVAGKIANQIRLMRYFGKHVKQTDPERFAKLQELMDSIAGALKDKRLYYPGTAGWSRPRPPSPLLPRSAAARRYAGIPMPLERSSQ